MQFSLPGFTQEGNGCSSLLSYSPVFKAPPWQSLPCQQPGESAAASPLARVVPEAHEAVILTKQPAPKPSSVDQSHFAIAWIMALLLSLRLCCFLPQLGLFKLCCCKEDATVAGAERSNYQCFSFFLYVISWAPSSPQTASRSPQLALLTLQVRRDRSCTALRYNHSC